MKSNIYILSKISTKNKYPTHKCGREFIILIRNNKNNKIIICQNCKLIYKSDEIIMYCPFDKFEFYLIKNILIDEKLKPATWEKYHCPIMLNQQMKCSQ